MTDKFEEGRTVLPLVTDGSYHPALFPSEGNSA